MKLPELDRFLSQLLGSRFSEKSYDGTLKLMLECIRSRKASKAICVEEFRHDVPFSWGCRLADCGLQMFLLTWVLCIATSHHRFLTMS